MNKDIKDYLHLYLGGKCKYKYVDWDTWNEQGIDLKILDRLYGDYSLEVKPILRPLSDMTHEELQDCGNLVYDFSDDDSGLDLNNHRPDDFLLTTSEQFHWLIQRHFDVFGLIECGIAIDKKTLNKQS